MAGMDFAPYNKSSTFESVEGLFNAVRKLFEDEQKKIAGFSSPAGWRYGFVAVRLIAVFFLGLGIVAPILDMLQNVPDGKTPVWNWPVIGYLSLAIAGFSMFMNQAFLLSETWFRLERRRLMLERLHKEFDIEIKETFSTLAKDDYEEKHYVMAIAICKKYIEILFDFKGKNQEEASESINDAIQLITSKVSSLEKEALRRAEEHIQEVQKGQKAQAAASQLASITVEFAATLIKEFPKGITVTAQRIDVLNPKGVPEPSEITEGSGNLSFVSLVGGRYKIEAKGVRKRTNGDDVQYSASKITAVKPGEDKLLKF